MNLRQILLIVSATAMMFITLSSCHKSGKETANSDDPAVAVAIDSAAYKYAKAFIEQQKERLNSSNRMSIRSFDTTRKVPILTYEYFIDNQELSDEDFFREVDSVNIKHLTRIMDRRKVNATEEDEDTLVFSENGDRIFPQYELVTKLSAFSYDYVEARLFDIDHVDLHYTMYDVLYLSLGSSETGAMSTQVYDSKTGGHITSFSNNQYNGSYYIGNGIIKNMNNLNFENLDDIEKVRVVTMIDDQFSFREFETKDIISDKEL